MALRWKISHPRLCARLVLSRPPPHHDPPWVTEKFAGPYPGEEEEGKRGLSLPAPVKRKPPYTSTSPQSVPPSPSGGRTLSEWTAETDLRHGRPIWFQSREQVPGSWKALGGGRPQPHCAPQQRPPECGPCPVGHLHLPTDLTHSPQKPRRGGETYLCLPNSLIADVCP